MRDLRYRMTIEKAATHLFASVTPLPASDAGQKKFNSRLVAPTLKSDSPPSIPVMVCFSFEGYQLPECYCKNVAGWFKFNPMTGVPSELFRLTELSELNRPVPLTGTSWVRIGAFRAAPPVTTAGARHGVNAFFNWKGVLTWCCFV
jgi:hypothetical protein